MKINSITGYCNNNVKHYGKNVHQKPSFGTARVDKSMMRFYEFNEKRLPTSVKDFLSTMPDKFAFSPLELQRKAYEKLNLAKTVEDVQNLFPNEELFIYLESLRDTKACNGLLGLYREFKDLFENGILKENTDFTVYLLKKFFVEAKTIDEINLDLDEDLHPDIKTEFKRRYPSGQYLHSSTLKSLGIYLPDVRYQNSLKFTREGYSDAFGLRISEAQYRYWNSLSEEQRFEILSGRCEGRDNWWNSLSYNEKLEYAAGVNSEDELYSDYKSFVRVQKRKSKTENVVGEAKLTKKRIAVGSANLKDKDIFVLWMKKNIERFYANLSERDKDTVHLKRVRRLTVRWQEMSPEERTELIQKMRLEREPIRFAMIDAWNHYPELIKELSAFLKEQQIFKPVDLLYSSEEFSEFQSKVMTEFWATHRDMAEIFGEKIRDAQSRVEDALMHGQFEDLKQEILRNRAYRIKMLEHEKRAEERTKATEAAAEEKTQVQEPVKAEKALDYKEDFAVTMKETYDPDNLLPKSYIKDMTDFYEEIVPAEAIKECTQLMKEGKSIFEIMSPYINSAEGTEKHNYIAKIERALSVAIANELYSQGMSADVYTFPIDTLILMIQQGTKNDYIKKPINTERITRQYEEFKKDLSDEEGQIIANDYFIYKINNNFSVENANRIASKYFSSYGRTLLIAFSEKSAYPDDVKIKYFKNFMDNMPEELKAITTPFWETEQNIRDEHKIGEICNKVRQRLGFLPQEIGKLYTKELAANIRMFENPYNESKQMGCTKEEYEIVAKTLSFENLKQQLCERPTRTKARPFGEIDKSTFALNTKLRLLAIEQAMADELYRVSRRESLYKLSFEMLVNFFETLLIMGNKGENVIENAGRVYKFREQPKVQPLKMNYLKYYNELKEVIPEGTKEKDVDVEEILYTLNPYEDKPRRDECIKERLRGYFRKS